MLESWQRNGRVVLGLLLLLLTAGILVLLYGFLYYPPTYVQRVFENGYADVNDYLIFPERGLQTSDTPFVFEEDSRAEQVAARFEQQAAIEDLEAFLTDTGTQAFIVIEDDRVVYEGYFNGAQRDSIVTSFSIAKSFLSALIGIAIDEGAIDSVQDPITDYLPELAQRNPDFAAITIEDLLRMSSGIRYEEFPFLNGDDVLTYYYPDLRALALESTHIEAVPGQTFHYNNYHPLLLGLILERATGMTVADYLEQKLWQPLGMAFAGSWSLDSEESAFEKMESGINGRAIDFAKFGRLYLREGNRDGAQLVPEAWVADSTRPFFPSDDYYPPGEMFANGYYGYMWWGFQREGGNDFCALGNYGQFIYVAPTADLIIVRHGTAYGVPAAEWMRIFYAYASPDAGESKE